MATKYLDINGLLYLWNKIKSLFVTQEAGKGLSENSYTTPEKDKLAGLFNYTHPTYSPRASGLYKIVVDGSGHVSSVTPVVKGDITELGVPGEKTEVVDSLVSSSITSALSAKQGAALKGLIDQIDTDGDGVADNAAKLGGQIPVYYENVLTAIKVNGAAQTISSKAVDLSIPTNNNQLTNGAEYQTPSNVKSIVEEYGYQTAAQVTSALSSAISRVYKPSGSYAFASLPAPSKDTLGNVYNVANAFTTTATFIEGAGHTHPAGTNIVVILDGTEYKFDVMAGMVDLTDYMLTADLEAITNNEIDAICA